ncbi:33 kDa protein [Aviadenovirus phalacrocoracidae]|uniref:33 kDa protein n=1 Tax=Aviadenovirus sp. TaxID=2217649 RepID=A0ABZ0T1J2_9ADEN|nr:33 kDa protein [Aviadenovirus sp.]
MAQRMLDEKTRAVELQNQTAENVFPQRSEGESEEDVDGESLGSRDTETESETEEEEYSDALPPPPKSVPRPKSTRGSNRKRAVGKGASKADEKPAAKRREPTEIVYLRSDILKLLLEIDSYARKLPDKRIAIRNRTRESITRQLHYERDDVKLTKMKTDAQKLLELWKAAN